MASLISGYEYDIFISYRQKDNKGDRWVSEFVEALKTELESTFKEEISVYFDINPHDGLLETHDVDASLEEKLRCLVCIPVISRTYCDPNSYAWEHEFRTFIKNASNDHFGLKIKLPNGNFASRVLPVRIHDLDKPDIRLFESTIGSALRSIDFVYKETGVNRQLRAKDDDIIKSTGHVLYRDQINKVSLAVKDIIDSMRFNLAQGHSEDRLVESAEITELKEIITDAQAEPSVETIEKPFSKEVKTAKKRVSVQLKPLQKIIAGASLFIISALIVMIIIAKHNSKIRWAKQIAIPSIYRLTNEGKYISAFNLATKAEKYIPDDPELKRMWSGFSNPVSTVSEPSGAAIYYRDYDAADSNWTYIGTTPLDSVRLPFCFARIKVEKEGFRTVYDATNSAQLNIRNYILDSAGKVPENMVHIPGIRISLENTRVNSAEAAEMKDFLIDKYEVTNKDFRKFVDSGGYRTKKYWLQPFIKNEKTLTWEETMPLFVDKTGRNGPSTWEAGDYPAGYDNYPVGGISWYEAAAYAEFAGKSLPTYYHWRRAAGLDYRQYLPKLILAGDGVWGISFVILNSNINSRSPSEIGQYKGMTSFGTCDMVGNVREWCWNEINPDGNRYILGGGWSDPSYIASEDYFQPPFDRSAINGLRCARYLHNDESLTILHSPGKKSITRDFMHEKPVSEQQFEILKRMYVYDRSDLHAKVESEDRSEPAWIKQKILFDAPYGNERITAYLFIPVSFNPPFQTVIYFPGASAQNMLSSKSLAGMPNIDFIIKTGRAVIYPVFKGTYERQYPSTSDSENAVAYREHVIQWYKDMARSLDYLETRRDIDTSSIAYFGFSWGGRVGPIMTVLDRRIKLSILYVAGIKYSGSYPEVDPFNFVSRVRIPTLMLNGKYDADFPYESSQKPLYELLGTPKEDKRQYLYETGHFVPRNELIKETLSWLDKYFGPVKQSL